MNFFHKHPFGGSFLATLVGFAFLLPVLVVSIVMSSSDTIEQSLYIQTNKNILTSISCLQISDTYIHLAKESHESSQQRDLQVAPHCFTVHFKTSSMIGGASVGKFYILGYGYVPLECQENGAECNITICGRKTLDIVSSTSTPQGFWRFSITGHIGPLVDHAVLGPEHPTTSKQNSINQLFPTNMGGKWDFYQSYRLVKTPTQRTQEWIDTDPFSSSDNIIMVSRIVIHYILWTPRQERMTKSTLKMLLYCPHSLTFGHSSFTNLGGTIRSRKSLLCHKRWMVETLSRYMVDSRKMDDRNRSLRLGARVLQSWWVCDTPKSQCQSINRVHPRVYRQSGQLAIPKSL